LLPSAGLGTVVVIQPMLPDELFTAFQRQRLEELMEAWRRARDAGKTLPAVEAEELEGLVAAELTAATERSRRVLQGLQQ
jgi:hypothetical protein